MVSKEDDDSQLIGEAKNAMNVNSGDDLSLEDRINMLNADQRHVFDKIHNHLLHQQQHATNGCSCENFLALMSGSVIAHGSSDAHILLIKAFVVSIRNKLPVPATPLRNIDWQHH